MKAALERLVEADDFTLALRRETLRLAQLRYRLFAGTVVVVAPIAIALSVVAARSRTGPELTAFPMVWILGIMGALVLFEWRLARHHQQMLDAGEPPSRLLAHVTGIAEMTVPTLLIVSVASSMGDPLLALGSSAPWAYFVFIFLSTLYLDFKICVISGLAAAAQYLAVALYFLAQIEAATIDPGLAEFGGAELLYSEREILPFFHYQKALVFMVAGFIAGFVAHEIRKRVSRLFEEAQNRQTILSVFGQLTAPAVVDELLAKGGEVESERRHVCVLFLDVRGYSTAAEGAPPEEVVAFLNRLFDYTIEVIHRRGGIVHQLLGDGLMAMFGAPVSHGDDSRNALDAALEIVDGLKANVSVPEGWPTRIGIGLHAGDVVAGLVGSKIHREYKVTGDVVNTAARIEQACKQFDARLLVSDAVLPDDWADSAEDLGPVTLRGREKPVHLFKLR